MIAGVPIWVIHLQHDLKLANVNMMEYKFLKIDIIQNMPNARIEA